MNLRDKLDSLTAGIVSHKEKHLIENEVPKEVVSSKLDAEMKEYIDKVEAEIKANPDNSAASNLGAELIPSTVTINDVISVVRKKASFLQGMTGFHGNTLQKNVTVPIIGDIGFARGTDEWTSGNFFESDLTNALPTDGILIPQKKMKIEIGISEWLQTYSVTDTMAKIKAQIPETFMYTTADAMLNADSTATSTGNINSDDQLAATTFSATGGAKDRRMYYDDGLRKQPINGSANVDKVDLGTLETNDFFTLMSKLRGDVTPDECLTLMDKITYYTLMGLDDFKDMSINGKQSTITKSAVANIGGSDVFMTELMRRSAADGKLNGSDTGSNTKGSIVYTERNVIQYGYGKTLKTQLYEDIEKGVLLKAIVWYGQASINKKGGKTEPSTVIGYNIT